MRVGGETNVRGTKKAQKVPAQHEYNTHDPKLIRQVVELINACR